jgi:glutamyl-tRNA synthetase
VTEPTPRLRFAPSPTGYLHVGSARTVLFNWLEARRTGGSFLLRIEDTDTERNRPELVDDILAMIRWLGLDWDGEPVHQSDRLDLYADAAERLFAGGHAYYCECTPEQVQARNKERGGPPGYDGYCRDRDVERGPNTPLRFRTPDEGTTEFHDLIRGDVSFENKNLEDFVLVRSNGMPMFLLANAVDDADMGITHVLRGEEHVNGTPKYLLIGEALGLDLRPVFAHLPVLVNEKRQKLSKRRDDVSVADFKRRGILPEAMRNYLGLLGWGPKDGVEIRPIEEFVELFRLEDVTPSPAFFDQQKLKHVNGEYIRALPTDEFVRRAHEFIPDTDAARAALDAIAPLVQERVETLADVVPYIDFLYGEPVIDEDDWAKQVAKDGERSAAILDSVIDAYARAPWEVEPLHGELLRIGELHGLKLGKAQAPVRIAVTGRRVGPPLFESLVALGRDATLDRLRAARARLA